MQRALPLLATALFAGVLVAACGHGRSESAPESVAPAAAPRAADPVAAPVVAPAAPVVDAPKAAASSPPQPVPGPELYAACRERVEGREAAGECTTDADCVAAGCSGEVCLARPQAEGLVTTCEVQPCYQALDACGCVEGMCRWSVKEGPFLPAPGNGKPIHLPQ